jgi:hypothetical protein
MPLNGPRSAGLPSGHVGVVWIDGSSATAQAAVVDAQGNVTAPAMTLSTPRLPDGGLVEQVFAADVTARGGELYFGWGGFQATGSGAHFRSYNEALVATGPVDTISYSGETPVELRVSPTAAAWIATGLSGASVRFVLGDGGTTVFGSNADPNSMSGLAVVDGAAFWIESKVLKGRFAGGSAFNLTPVSSSISGTQAISTDGGAVFVGYEIDHGTADGIDLDYQSICPR